MGASPTHCLLSLHSNYPPLSHSRAGTSRCRSPFPPSLPSPFPPSSSFRPPVCRYSSLGAHQPRSFHPYCCGFIESATHCPRASETPLLFKENWRAVRKRTPSPPSSFSSLSFASHPPSPRFSVHLSAGPPARSRFTAA